MRHASQQAAAGPTFMYRSDLGLDGPLGSRHDRRDKKIGARVVGADFCLGPVGGVLMTESSGSCEWGRPGGGRKLLLGVHDHVGSVRVPIGVVD